MSETQAVGLARDSAQALGWPWGPQVVGRRRRVWPFPARWLVTARDPETGVTTRIVVHERTRGVWPSSVVYPRRGAGPAPRRKLRGRDSLRAAAGAAAGVLGALVLGWPWWAGAVLAIPGAMVGLGLLRPRRTTLPRGSDGGQA